MDFNEIFQHLKDFDLMVLCDAVRSGKAQCSDDALKEILLEMETDTCISTFWKAKCFYNTIKVCQIVYYMFGYKLKIKGNKVERVVFSPLEVAC